MVLTSASGAAATFTPEESKPLRMTGSEWKSAVVRVHFSWACVVELRNATNAMQIANCKLQIANLNEGVRRVPILILQFSICNLQSLLPPRPGARIEHRQVPVGHLKDDQRHGSGVFLAVLGLP